MGYFLTSEPENAVPGKSSASPKTHTPLSRLQERGQRFYFPELGRWISRDTIQEEGGINLYVSVLNAATCFNDLLGLLSFSNGMLPDAPPPPGTFVDYPQDGTAGWADYVRKGIAEAAGLAYGMGPFGYGPAGRLLLHYLGRSGTEMSISFGDLIDDSTGDDGGSVRRKRAKDILDLAEAMGSRQVTVGIVVSGWQYQGLENSSMGWFFAVGSHCYALHGPLVQSDSTKVEAFVDFHLYDPYDFVNADGGFPGQLSNQNLRRLHEVGLAKNFLVRGVSKETHITWNSPPPDGSLGLNQKSTILNGWRGGRPVRIDLCGKTGVDISIY